MRLLQPRDSAISHICVTKAHLTHGIDVDGAIVNCPLSHIIFNVLSVVATWLTVNVDRCVVTRNFKRWVEG